MYAIRSITITDAMLVSSDIPETDYSEYAAGTTYAADDYCIVAAEHKVYKSLQNGNTGHTPATSATWWLDCGATNRWAPFDKVIGTQASKTTSMTWTLAPGLIDSISVLNMEATSVQITLTDPVEGIIYDSTTDLVTTINVIDEYTYWFEPIIWATSISKLNLATAGLPPYPAATITITITNTGGTAKCGTIVVGLKLDIGQLQYEAQPGLVSYSTIEEDETFGTFSVTKRPGKKKMTGTLVIKNTIIDFVLQQMALYDGEFLVFVGHEQYECLQVYGICKEFSPTMKYKDFTYVDFEVRGTI